MTELVLRKVGDSFSGRYRFSQAEEFRTITMDGMDTMQWQDDIWDKIIVNLQISVQYDFCRILFVSDTEIQTESIPQFNTGTEKWTFEEITGFLREIDDHPSEWILNGTYLNGRFRRFFPVSSDTKKGKKYLYTLPCLEIQEDKLVSPSEIMRSMEPL